MKSEGEGTETAQKSLRLLIVEDSPDDTELLARQIRAAGYELHFRRVESGPELAAALGDEAWQAIISDYSMPGFSGLDALEVVKQSGLDLPFILVSGTIGEEFGVQAMKAGVSDYLMKDRLGRLVPAIERELREAVLRQAKKRIESDRIDLIERLQAALRARDEFLLVASHELKTPLTSLRLQVQLLRRLEGQNLEAAVKEKRRHDLRAALELQLDRLDKLIEDLLDVSRITVGRLALEESRIDLVSVVRKVLEDFRDYVRQAGCRLELRADQPVVGVWDPVRIEQVAANLIGNAVKYSGGLPVLITIEMADGRARLIVKDQGAGISASDQERLFERFERAGSVDHVGGLGLGLYVSREIVRAHGGTIRIESAPGHGSEFIVELPLAPAKPERKTA